MNINQRRYATNRSRRRRRPAVAAVYAKALMGAAEKNGNPTRVVELEPWRPTLAAYPEFE